MPSLTTVLDGNKTTYRVGVDIGGTFADYSLLDEERGELIAFKSPTIPKDPAEGVIRGLRALVSEFNLDPSKITHFVHGSTIAVNTLIQRTGATCSLFTTEGFRDIFRIQRLRVPNPFDFNTQRPAPLIPRRRVFEIKERIRSDGSVFVPLDEESVTRAVEKSLELGAEAIVICLINAYKNGQHERRIKEIITEMASHVRVVCSSDVWPEMREYERAVTTAMSGYVGPKMACYLESLETKLKQSGIQAPLYVTKSNGGITTAMTASTETVKTLLSGPASGVVGATYVAGLAGYRDLITLDLGGTSADIAVVQHGKASYSTVEHVAQLPLIMPVIGVSSIGAGGGSIAWLDAAGVLKVGPQSAGAEPGPACYGLGNEEPTLSDAFLVCGLLNPENFLGGRMKLDVNLAQKAIRELGQKLQLGTSEAAQAIINVAVANMYTEFSNVLSREGLDPREFTLVAFGGAGPLLATFLAKEFNIPRVLVPLSPGTLGAFGSLMADVKNEYIRSIHMGFERVPMERLKSDFEELRSEALNWLEREGPIVEGTRFHLTADMRYVGQAYEIEIDLHESWLHPNQKGKILETFHQRHQELYAHSDVSSAVEIVNLRLRIVGTTRKPYLKQLAVATGEATSSSQRTVHYGNRAFEAKVYDRRDLLHGHLIAGPAIVEQYDTTVLVPDGFAGQVDQHGNILVQEAGETASPKGLDFKTSAGEHIVDRVMLEILRSYSQASVESMSRVIERTAYTTFIKESLDFATALSTPEGEFFAYPRGMGVSSYIGLDLSTTLRLIPHYDDGDIILTNDPYTTKGLVSHLPDLHLYKPIFHDGKLIAFAWCFLHSSDIGGFVPASVYTLARDLFQEGLRITPLKLYCAGEVNQTLVDMIKANCRIPDANWGDLKAAVAGLNTGERYLHQMIAKFGAATVRQGMYALLDYSEKRTGDIIAAIPDGTYSFHDYLDSDVVSDIPVRLAVTINKRGSDIELDFTGSDVQLNAPFNVPTGGAPTPLLATAVINYAVTMDPHMPLNRGLMRRVQMKLPQGSVVNPEYPAACGVRYATVHRVFDTCLGALTQAVPGQVPAAGAGQGCPVVVSLLKSETGKREVMVVEPLHGGGGGRVDQDGIDGNEASSGFLRNTPVESVELHLPIVVRRYDLIPDSAGAGRHRGGFANRLDIQVFQPEVEVTARSAERHRFQAWGVHGGLPGAAGKQILNPRSPQEKDLGKISLLRLEAGDILSMRAPGGAGYGDPLERDPELVLEDVLDGLVSSDAAEKTYGTIIVDGSVDLVATEHLRASIGSGRKLRTFDFGSAREAYERIWSEEIYQVVLGLLMDVPTPLRAYARQRMHDAVRRLSQETGKPITVSDLHAAWETIKAAMAGPVS